MDPQVRGELAAAGVPRTSGRIRSQRYRFAQSLRQDWCVTRVRAAKHSAQRDLSLPGVEGLLRRLIGQRGASPTARGSAQIGAYVERRDVQDLAMRRDFYNTMPVRPIANLRPAINWRELLYWRDRNLDYSIAKGECSAQGLAQAGIGGRLVCIL